MTDKTKTRAELILSAQQWVTAVREEWLDSYNDLAPPIPPHAHRMLRKLNELAAAIERLKEMEK